MIVLFTGVSQLKYPSLYHHPLLPLLPPLLPPSAFTPSQAVGDGLNAGFYDLHAQLRGIPILEMQAKRFMHTLSALDAASTKAREAGTGL